MRSRFLLLPLLSVIAVAVACADRGLPTEPPASDPMFAIGDATSGYKAGFYWLPPMVSNPSTSGTFDADLSPEVEICALHEGECADHLVTFTMDGHGSERVRLEAGAEHYIVNWHTNQFDLTGATHYRISVLAGPDVLLGFADVQPVSNGQQLRNVDTGEYIGLIDGRTLRIRFRIETGIVATIAVSPEEETVAPGGTQQFTATLFDLHDQPMSGTVTWASDDTNVATIDGNGLATAVDVGTTVITATAEHITGSATLTVAGSAASGFSAISVGGDTCALDAAGNAYCWGFGWHGNLGHGGSGETAVRLVPTAVAGGHTFASISAGVMHTCALTPDHRAYCWGHSLGGKLGHSGDFRVPGAVSGGLSFASISAGPDHTCGITTDGEAYCWGAGFWGKLGYGGTESRGVPTLVAGGHTWASISLGNSHTCGMTTAGEAYCWGFGGNGRLGNNSTATEVTPVAVFGGLTFISLSAFSHHTCGITTDYKAYCWGQGGSHTLGNGFAQDRLTPFPVQGDLNFALISVGGIHTCAVAAPDPLAPVTSNGYCWGSNNWGQLGVGNQIATMPAPAEVSGGITFASISAGPDRTCGLTTDGEAYCWGYGPFGGLGYGGTESHFAPVRVADPL
jgi:alpha-tubulin suppressor-like RCC1 family protein